MAKKAFNLLDEVQIYNKAIAAFVAGVVVLFAREAGFPVDQSLVDAIGVVVTALVVYAIPNKK